jgi:hypothetical protein
MRLVHLPVIGLRDLGDLPAIRILEVVRELPAGRLVVSVSKHYTAVLDGVIHDTHDPQRDASVVRPDRGEPLAAGERRVPGGQVVKTARRCVYGYWILRAA